ncbi:MAG: hypothetical protein RLZZ585_175 [Bacteroidota bacterium]|jgi:hypothetical protein
MNKFYFLTLFFLSALNVFGQSKAERDTVYLDQIYKDASTYLVSQRVLEFDSLSATELMKRFENWGGQNFRNYEHVRTSKTESQITLNYITSSFNPDLDFYIIMVVEFKENKMRVQIFDDANVYKPGSYAGTTYIAGISARTIHIASYFKEGMIDYKLKPGMMNYAEKQATGALAYKASVESGLDELYSFIKLNTAANGAKKTDDGW